MLLRRQAGSAAAIPGRGPYGRPYRRETLLQHMARNRWCYLLLLPGLVYMLIFQYIPMYGVVIAFKNFSIVKGIWASPWIGLDNFISLFKSSGFYQILSNSILISIYRLAWGFPAPILLALILNEVRNMLFKRTVQTILYIPHFVSWVVIAGLMVNMLSPAGGVVNQILQMFGVKPVNFLMEPAYFRSIIVVSEIWKEAGWGTIIYLAAISGIDTSLYEAAIVDGANRLQQMRHITLPGILGTIVVLLILRMGFILSNGFEQIFLMYNPLVYRVADVFETYTYRVGLMEGRFSFATAVGVFQSVVGIVLILATNWIAKRYGEGGLW